MTDVIQAAPAAQVIRMMFSRLSVVVDSDRSSCTTAAVENLIYEVICGLSARQFELDKAVIVPLTFNTVVDQRNQTGCNDNTIRSVTFT